jgi:hypothetical protein
MNQFKLLFIALISQFFFSSVLSQTRMSCVECSSALEKDKIFKAESLDQVFYFYENLSETVYNKYKLDIAASASIPIPIPGAQQIFGLIEASADYNEFKEKLRVYKRELESSGSYSFRSSNIEYRTNPIAYQYWSECIKNTCGSKPGVYMWIENEDEFNIQIKCIYTPAPGNKDTKYTLKVQTEDSVYKLTGKLKTNGEFSEILKRKYNRTKKSKTMVILNTEAGYSTSIEPSYYRKRNNAEEQEIKSIEIGYISTERKTINSNIAVSEDMHNRSCDFCFLSSETSTFGGSITLPKYPLTCDRQWLLCYIELFATISNEDSGFVFSEPPILFNNVKCLNGACAHNDGYFRDNRCQHIWVVKDEPTFKHIVMAVGSVPTSYQMQIPAIKQKQLTTVIPHYISDGQVKLIIPNTIYDKANSVTITFSNGMQRKIPIDTFKRFSKIANNGIQYTVTIENIITDHFFRARQLLQ